VTAVSTSPSPTPPLPEAPARIRGIAIPLPAGEQVRWQGAPVARSLARFTFQQRKVALYVLVMLAWWSFNAIGDLTPDAMLRQGVLLLGLAIVPIAVTEVLARLVAGSTVYAITDRRVVMKVGFVFPMTLNIPHRVIASGGIRRNADGTGQLAMPLIAGERLAYVALWPHCRPFEITRPVPVLRGLADVEQVGQLLREAVLAQDGGAESVPALSDLPARGRTAPPAPATA
jgi:hypothetical protein